ncbi:hypothetical protein P7K49_017328 [Saguinus oedipus]|uniref:Uncharacterized protein n=1 Tax=Saguinus oedipus TaxID=9490 RepID=A0ABQ9V274_SAGOE|nr:hypothetical protein P7K49_017328 [Saguinus oedipus]
MVAKLTSSDLRRPHPVLACSWNCGFYNLSHLSSSMSYSIFDNNRQDPTGLTAALQATDLAGVLHMLYCVLFHGTILDPSTASPKESYTQNTIQVAIHSLRFFNSFAALDLSAFQVPSIGLYQWRTHKGVPLNFNQTCFLVAFKPEGFNNGR